MRDQQTVSSTNIAPNIALRRVPCRPQLLSCVVLVASATSCRNDERQGAAGDEAVGPEPAVLSASLAPVRFGEEAKNPYFRARVLNWKPCAVESHLEPPPGVRKVAVELELTAAGAADVPSNPFYAQLADKDGRFFESTLAGCPPLLAAARLRTGESARGWITFDVPESSVPQALVYQPAVIGVSPPKVELLLSP